MLQYFLWGGLITFIFDMILKGGEHELNNWERLAFLILWPILLCWFLYYTIKNFRNNGR